MSKRVGKNQKSDRKNKRTNSGFRIILGTFLLVVALWGITACAINGSVGEEVRESNKTEQSGEYETSAGVKAALPGTGQSEAEKTQQMQSQQSDIQQVQPQTESPQQLSWSGQSAQDFVEQLGVGWNLGNTLDPVDCTWLADNMEMEYETAWGNPKVTKELIHYIKSEGFSTMRKAAEAMNCEFVYYFKPRTTFQNLVDEQAQKKAAEVLKTVNVNMALENQEIAEDEAVKDFASDLINTKIKQIWD